MERSGLLDSFLTEARTDLATLRAGVEGLQGQAPEDGDQARLTSLGVLAHRMRGSAGLYGFPQLSRMAALLERVLDARPELGGALRAPFLELLHTAVRVLEGGLNRAAQGERESDLGLEFSRAGGATQLQTVLRAQPLAFVPRPLPSGPHDDPALDETGLDEPAERSDAAADPGTGGSTLEGTLRAFVQEQGEVWEYFAPEVREHLGHLRTQLDEPQPDLDVMFRAAHTIKGSSFMVGLPPLGDFAHRLEDVLGAARDGLTRLDAPLREELRQAADLADALLLTAEAPAGAPGTLGERIGAQAARLAALASGEAPQPGSPAPSAPEAGASESAAPAAAPQNATLRVPARQIEGLMDQMSELVTSRARLGQALARLDELQRGMQDSQLRFQRMVRDFEERHLNPDMLRGAEGEARPELAGLNPTEGFNELELDTYSDLNILARGVTELSADFAEVRGRLSAAVGELQDEHDAMGKLLRRLRADVTRTSRLPFSQVTARLRRWAREHQGRLEFVTVGDDLKVDSATLQRLGEPLLHLLTNALHHGLGSADQRAAAGKAARGRVELRATQRGGFLEITVQDDGQGLDLEAIRERALARGLRSAQELGLMSGDEVARLILLPGLSTAASLSTVAGRGVGMDVVATTTRQLGGELLISSVPDEGTAFTLRLPTTRRIMDILQVRVGEVELAFAVNSVRALRELPASETRVSEHGSLAPFEGRWVPVVDLRALWGVESPGDTFSLVVLSTLSGDVAARVDSFGTIQESAVTPPDTLLGALDFLSGTALSPSGEVLPLLEAQGLLRLARRPETWLRAEGQLGAEPRRGRLLLVDDSLSVRRVVGNMLTRAGFDVQTANDGQDALERLQQDAGFDAVVSDLEMPRMNGFELLGALRGRPATAALPVVIMTTRAGEKHQRLAFSMGATDYFTKPINEALLLRRMASIVAAASTEAADMAPAVGAASGTRP
ncbi:Hpt domain-containing protein [Deinococcus koreensis]|uniref:hybrid sensor histidine kinase/response regulator n=1 Tax=Deinococcus koreensis TaxID=2054903 RepID=UPI001FB048A5|nr:Hpt domain-containing protein [Deinococcus koreensis]